jgi:hypothetical protein
MNTGSIIQIFNALHAACRRIVHVIILNKLERIFYMLI